MRLPVESLERDDRLLLPAGRWRRGHGRLAAAIAISAALHSALLYVGPWRIDPSGWEVAPEPVEIAVSIADAGPGLEEIAAADGVEAVEVHPPPPRPSAARGDRSDAETAASEAAVGTADEAVGEAVNKEGAALPDRFEATSEPAVVAEVSSAGNLAGLEPAEPGAGNLTGLEPVEPAVDAPLPAPVVAARESPLPTKSFSVPQKKMLAKKVEDWAETFQRKHEPGEEIVWKHKGQRYPARFTSLPGGDPTSLDRLAVEIETEQEGNRLSTTLRLKRLAFSNFAQFVNRWDANVQIHDDELDGRFHSNSEINLSYSRKVGPKFLGKVTTSARTINVSERRGFRRRDDIFQGGLETGVRSIRLPRDYVPLPETLDVDDANRQEFSEDTRVVFREDGSYSYVSTQSGLFERRGSLRQPVSYLVATGKAELDVRGTVRGRVLVYSPTRIVISGDLRYADDPETGDGTENYIGLVSGKTVEIAEPEVTGPGDLTVEAAIYAQRRFRVREYRRRNEGTLEIFGSLTAGSLSATEPRYGTRIRFDPRLEQRRPPGFPVTDRFEVEEWEEVWTVAEAGPVVARDAAGRRSPATGGRH